MHGLVHVEGVQARCIEPGQPHVPNNHQSERVRRVLQAPLELLLLAWRRRVPAQVGQVRRRAVHHHLDDALVEIFGVPVGPQLDDLVVERDRRWSRHGDDHRLAVHDLKTAVPMRDQIGGELLQPTVGHRDGLEPSQPGDGLTLFGFVLGLQELVEVLVESLQFVRVDCEVDDPALVVDRHRGAVTLGRQHVVDVHVLPEDRLRILVVLGDRGAGQAQVHRVGQGLAHVVCEAIPYPPGLSVELGFEAVLRAVCLIADHDDVAAIAEHLHRLAGLVRSELLDCGEEHAAGLLVAQHLLEVVHLLCLMRLGPKRDRTGGKGLEHLAVQIVAVGHDHDRRVLQLRMLAQQANVEQGDQALAAALREPHHAALAVLSLCGCLDRPLSGFAYAVVLVIPRDQLGGT